MFQKRALTILGAFAAALVVFSIAVLHCDHAVHVVLGDAGADVELAPPPHRLGASVAQPTDSGLVTATGGQTDLHALPFSFGVLQSDGGYAVFTVDITINSIDGVSVDELDAGATRLLLRAAQAKLGAFTSFPNSSEVVGGRFSNATSWVAIAQKPVTVNSVEHFLVLFLADDFSGPDGGGANTQTLTAGTKKCNLEMHAHRLIDGGTILLSQGGLAVSAVADSGLPTVSLSCVAATEDQCDSGVCTPGTTSAFGFQGVVVSPGLVQIQAIASGMDGGGFPWLWSVTSQDITRTYQ